MNPVRRLAAPLREMRWGQVILELALLMAGILAALAAPAATGGPVATSAILTARPLLRQSPTPPHWAEPADRHVTA